MPPKRFSEAQEKQIIADYKAGETAQEICAKYGGSSRVVYDTLKRYGIKARRPVKRVTWTGSDGQRAEAIRLYTSGTSMRECARLLHVREDVIREVIRTAGVPVGLLGGPIPVFNEETASAAVTRYLSGESQSAIAKRYKTSIPTVGKMLRSRGVEIRPSGGPRIWTEENIKLATKLYRQGTSQTEIAKTIGCKVDAVSRVLHKTGVIVRERRKGNSHPSWQGGRITRRDGYIFLRPTEDDREFCPSENLLYIAEHRLVMARALGRPLRSDETVHHVNGDRADNRLENLQLRQGKHGTGVAIQCHDCGSHNVGPVPLAS